MLCLKEKNTLCVTRYCVDIVPGQRLASMNADTAAWPVRGHALATLLCRHLCTQRQLLHPLAELVSCEPCFSMLAWQHLHQRTPHCVNCEPRPALGLHSHLQPP
jgi:hypothetical protein